MSSIELVYGSCVDQKVDVVVNAANRSLVAGAGICGAIFSRAGYKELTDACQKVAPLKDGEVACTPAFNITNAKKIFHAVGPDFCVTPKAFKELYEAYYNSLLLLKENELHSISFPLISSGIFGGNLPNPVRESTKQCLRAYYNFVEEYPDYNIDVKLCVFSQKEAIQLVYENSTMEEIEEFMSGNVDITDEYLTNIAMEMYNEKKQ